MIENSIEELDNLPINNFRLEPYFTVYKQTIWLKDEFIKSCGGCDTEFSFMNRKHHCRHCGKIFCHTCANAWVKIPNYRLNTFVNEDDIPLDRVCTTCYTHLKILFDIRKFYFIFMMLPLDILELKRMALVSKKCNTVYKYYLTTVRNCVMNQNYHPGYKIESNIIWCNRYLYSGHSGWVLLLLKYFEENHSQLKIHAKPFLEILYKPRTHNCQELLCDHKCQETLSFSNSVYFINQYTLQNETCEKYVLDRLWDAEIEEYLCFFPIIIQNLSPLKKTLVDYLISTSSHNYQIANIFFWLLTYYINDTNNKCADFYQEVRVKLIDSVQKETREHLQNSYYFVENLKQFNGNPNFGILLQSYIETNKLNRKTDISCPLNPIKLIKGVDIDNIVIKSSYLKPIIIPFIDRDNEIFKIMVKKDDLTRDLIVMNTIKLIDTILKTECDLDLNITTYNILPISKEFGFIEIVSDAETIYSINKKYKTSILNYILDHNSHLSIDQVRDRFTKSCVSYCVLSYLLGIGDRHMENIMIRHNGDIFHIDFGFILGYDPKLLSPEIRLTKEMVDAMGGKSSKYYNLFKDLCTKSILCLRKHIDMFKLMLGSLEDTSITPNKKLCKQYIDKFIENKFLIGEDFNEVKLYLINKMDNQTKIYSDTIIDFCHNSITKESTNTLSNKAYNYGTSWVNYFYGK